MSNSFARTTAFFLLTLGLLASASTHPSARANVGHRAASTRAPVIMTGPGRPACPAGTHVGWFTNFCFPNAS